MRLVRMAAGAAALVLASGTAIAQSPSQTAGPGGPVAQQVLAPGELMLEISARGIGRTPAQTATFDVTISANGETREAAQAAHDAILARVREAARAAGVAPADFRPKVRSADLDVSDIDEPPPVPELAVPVPTPAQTPGTVTTAVPLVRVQLEPREPRPNVYRTYEIVLRTPARFDELTAAIRNAGGNSFGSPRFVTGDDTAARRAARLEALTSARAEADAYAAALNLRVIRMVRVTERVGFDFMSMMAGEMSGSRSMREMFEPADGNVPTLVFLGVDFILAPR